MDCESCWQGMFAWAMQGRESGFLGELLEDGHTDECAGLIEAHRSPEGVKSGSLMMDEALIPSDILEPLIRWASVLEGDFVSMPFGPKAEFDLLLYVMSSVLSSRKLLFRSVIQSHASSSVTHLSYLLRVADVDLKLYYNIVWHFLQ